MKKAIAIVTVLVLLPAMLVLAACGGSSSSEAGSSESSSSAAVAQPDWLAQHDLAVTPQGDFSFDAWAWDDSTYPTTFHIAIVEEPADKAGYVNQIATLSFESPAGTNINCWASPFDRYTGVTYRNGPSVYSNEGSAAQATTISHDGEQYDIEYRESAQFDGSNSTWTMTVTAPEDYDGCVFWVGYFDSEMNDAYAKMSWEPGTLTIDEFPNFTADNYFFTLTNK